MTLNWYCHRVRSMAAAVGVTGRQRRSRGGTRKTEGEKGGAERGRSSMETGKEVERGVRRREQME